MPEATPSDRSLLRRFRDREIDDELIAMMKKQNVIYIPTLTREISTYVYESTPKFFCPDA